MSPALEDILLKDSQILTEWLKDLGAANLKSATKRRTLSKQV